MGVRGRIAAGIRASSLSFVREPVNLALLVVLPALSIQIYGVSLGQFPAVGIFDASGSLVTTGRVTGAVFATGALAGVLGLFQMISARRADRRLVMAGFRPGELVAARFATVVALGVVVSAVSTVSLGVLLDEPLRSPGAAFAGLALAGVVYGLLGMLVGTVLPRELEGSLLLVIVADMDNVFASGLFDLPDSVARFAPLTHPHELVSRGVVEGELATGHLLSALAFVAAFGLLAVAAYAYAVEYGGDD